MPGENRADLAEDSAYMEKYPEVTKKKPLKPLKPRELLKHSLDLIIDRFKEVELIPK